MRTAWSNGFRGGRSAGHMLLTIVQNYLLHIMDDPVDWLFILVSDIAQSSMPREQRIRGRNMQGLVETSLRYMVDTSNIGDGHPGTYSTDITCHETLMVLLELLIGLDGASGGKKHTDQGQAQKKTYANKFDACFQAGLLPLLYFARLD